MSKIPSSITKMINSRMSKGKKASHIADEINGSRTAERLGVTYTTRSIAAAMANITRKNK